MLSSGSLETGTGSSNSLRSANESLSPGVIHSIRRNSPRVGPFDCAMAPEKTTFCCVGWIPRDLSPLRDVPVPRAMDGSRSGFFHAAQFVREGSVASSETTGQAVGC